MGIIEEKDGFVKIKIEGIEGEWWTPKRYVRQILNEPTDKLIVIDRKNQNIVTLQKNDAVWLIRSMNPDRKSTRLNSSHGSESRMPSSA